MLPRERIQTLGVESLSDSELLATILGTGIRKADGSILGAHNLAETLLAKHGGIPQLLELPQTVLRQIPGIGEVKACRIVAIGELLRRIRTQVIRQSIRKTDEALATFAHLALLDHEEIWVGFLNSKLELMDLRLVAKGDTESCSTYARVMVRDALKLGSTQVILAHNHPSGDCNPSFQDILFTEKVRRAFSTVGISIVDHVILARDGSFFSFAASGWPTSRSAKQRRSAAKRPFFQ